MNVISELDKLCIVAREAYGDRGVVLASNDSNWLVASPPVGQFSESTKDFGIVELQSQFPEAHAALPEVYQADQADGSLTFYVDNNHNLCCEHELMAGCHALWLPEDRAWV